MYTGNILAIALSAASLVNAHGKVLSITGDAGGNAASLATMGDAVPRFGPNSATEKDTTVFGGNPNKPLSDGLGKTAGGGKVTMADLKSAIAGSKDGLPKVAASGGTINGVWRTVTSDGTAINKQGDLHAVIDSTGTGAYSKGTLLVATSQMVGNGQGNVVQRALARAGVTRALRKVGLARRATNVGADAAIKINIPAGVTCTGNDPNTGMKNFCLLKVANNNGNGPFGSNLPFQIAEAGTSGNMSAKREVAFDA